MRASSSEAWRRTWNRPDRQVVYETSDSRSALSILSFVMAIGVKSFTCASGFLPSRA